MPLHKAGIHGLWEKLFIPVCIHKLNVLTPPFSQTMMGQETRHQTQNVDTYNSYTGIRLCHYKKSYYNCYICLLLSQHKQRETIATWTLFYSQLEWFMPFIQA